MSGIPHSGHDVGLLFDRWARLVEERGWSETVLVEEGGHPVLVIETGEVSDRAELYLSAGVHGDECAPIWGLLRWAEENSEDLTGRAITLMPCLNPVGIVENTRFDGKGVDLNRYFQDRNVPVIRAWQEYLEGRHYDVAINLHEDYDATGIYLYEVAREKPIGEEILAACESIIPRETAETVDGSAFENGLLSHEQDIGEVIERDLDGGWPEALYLYLRHATDSYTFETPSEWDLETRIRTHRQCLRYVLVRL